MLEWIHSHTLLPADGWILLLALFGALCIGLSKSGGYSSWVQSA